LTPEASGPPRGVERRRSPRLEPRTLTSPVSVVGTRLLNISHHGALIEAPVPLAVESSLRFRLVVEGVKSEIEARVAQCRLRSPAASRWNVGLEFTDIARDMQARLTRALGTSRVRPRSA